MSRRTIPSNVSAAESLVGALQQGCSTLGVRVPQCARSTSGTHFTIGDPRSHLHRTTWWLTVVLRSAPAPTQPRSAAAVPRLALPLCPCASSGGTAQPACPLPGVVMAHGGCPSRRLAPSPAFLPLPVSAGTLIGGAPPRTVGGAWPGCRLARAVAVVRRSARPVHHQRERTRHALEATATVPTASAGSPFPRSSPRDGDGDQQQPMGRKVAAVAAAAALAVGVVLGAGGRASAAATTTDVAGGQTATPAATAVPVARRWAHRPKGVAAALPTQVVTVRGTATGVAAGGTRAAPVAASAAAVSTPAAPRVPALAFGLSDRIVFAVDEFVQWNPAARLMALTLLSVALVGIGAMLFRRADPNRKEVTSPLWSAVRAYANPMEDDWDSNILRVVSCINAAAGMIFFALLVGMVTEGVESSIKRIDSGTSAVVATGHVLVCGWNGHVPRMLASIYQNNPATRVVVLATSRERSELVSELSDVLSLEQRRRIKLMIRPGVPILKEDLARVAAARASRIVLVASSPTGGDAVVSPAAREEANRLVISRALALRDALPDYKGGVLAELSTPRDEAIVRKILAPTGARVHTLNTDLAVHKFLAQATRQPGLCEVITRLMGDAPAETFRVVPVETAAPHLLNRRLSEVSPTAVPGSILCGALDAVTGAIHLGVGNANRVGDAPLGPGSRLVLLGARPGSKAAAKVPAADPAGGSTAAAPLLAEELTVPIRSSVTIPKSPESILICGWRPDLVATLEELGASVPRGSMVTIVSPEADLEVPKTAGNAKVEHIRGDPGQYEALRMALNRRGLVRRHGRDRPAHDHVLVLSSALNGGASELSADSLEEDSKSLASLAYVIAGLDSDGDGVPDEVHVAAEFMSARVGEIAAAEHAVGNVIMPRVLASRLAAQAVRDSSVYRLWVELLSQQGREVYVRPATEYLGIRAEAAADAGVNTPEPVLASFAQLARSVAAVRDDVVLGYVPVGSDGIEGAVLNPTDSDRDTVRAWGPGDQLIVMSDQ